MKTRLQLLQAYRGLAAVFVVLYHTGTVGEGRLGSSFLGGFFQAGHLGVDFFFVLSGFVIAFIHNDDIGDARTAPSYVLKRFFRIYPILFVLSLAKLGYTFSIGFGVPEHRKDLSLIISSLFLLPQEGKPFIEATWTLVHESLFYGVFLLVLLLGRRIGFFLLWCWAAAIVAFNLPFVQGLEVLPAFLLSPYNLQFLCGCFAAHLIAGYSWSRSCSLLTLALGLICVALGLIFYGPLTQQGALVDRGFWAVAFFLVVVGSVAVERGWELRVPGFLILTGDASYSIYLFHSSLQVLFLALVMRFFRNSTIDAQWILAMVALSSLGGGLLLWKLVEEPMLKSSKGLVSRLCGAMESRRRGT